MSVWWVVYLALIGATVAVEVVGVVRKGKRDTITEGWRAIDKRGGAVRWGLRFVTAGLLLWAAFHFLGDGLT